MGYENGIKSDIHYIHIYQNVWIIINIIRLINFVKCEYVSVIICKICQLQNCIITLDVLNWFWHF